MTGAQDGGVFPRKADPSARATMTQPSPTAMVVTMLRPAAGHQPVGT